MTSVVLVGLLELAGLVLLREALHQVTLSPRVQRCAVQGLHVVVLVHHGCASARAARRRLSQVVLAALAEVHVAWGGDRGAPSEMPGAEDGRVLVHRCRLCRRVLQQLLARDVV